jgi:hypothetical protein
MATTTLGYLANGTACDYTTWALFIAAYDVDADLPTTFTEDQLIQAWYSDNAQDTVWTEQFDFNPGATTGNYSFTLQGMVGDVASGDQITVTAAADGQMKFVGESGTFIVQNMAIANDGQTTHGIIGNPTRLFIKDCFIDLPNNAFNRSGIHFTGTYSRVEGSFIRIDGQGVYLTNGNMYNTIVIGEDPNTPTILVTPRGVQNCTLISASDYVFGPNVDLDYISVENSIMYGSELWEDAAASNRQFLGFRNNCVCQTTYTGKLWGNNTGADLWGTTLANKLVGTTILSDPLFVNGSGNLNTLADFALQSGSPCRYEALTQPTNPLYDSNKLEFPTMGAWTYFDPDFPERANVLTTDTVNGLAGTLTPDYPEPENVLPTDTTNGVTGTLSPDFPDASNVLTTDTTNGVQGTWVKADKTKYQDGQFFGDGGTSEEGEYDPISNLPQPNAPTISYTDNGDGTATITVAGSGATQDNTVYYAKESPNTLSFTGCTPFTNDGTVNISGEGDYYVYCDSDLGGINAISNVLKVTITNPSITNFKTSTWSEGRNKPTYVRATAPFAVVRVSCKSGAMRRWAMERITAVTSKQGMTR